MSNTNEVLILTALNDEDLAQEFIMDLLDQGLILSGTYWPVKVVYQWDGSVHIEDEYKLLLKAREAFFIDIEKYIMEKHHYRAPEIIKVDALFGSPAFREHLMANKSL